MMKAALKDGKSAQNPGNKLPLFKIIIVIKKAMSPTVDKI